MVIGKIQTLLVFSAALALLMVSCDDGGESGLVSDSTSQDAVTQQAAEVSPTSETEMSPGWHYFPDAEFVEDMALDSEGRIWTVGFNGAAVINPTDSAVIYFTEEDGLYSNNLLSVAISPDGTAWFGPNNDRINSFDGSIWQNHYPYGGATEISITSIEVGPDESMYFGRIDGDGGLYRLEEREWTEFQQETAMDNFVEDIVFDSEENLWVATQGGVLKFDGDTWTSFDKADGLAASWTTAIAVDPDGSIWVGTLDKGLSHYDGSIWRTYTQEDGLVSDKINDLATAQDGGIWIATDKGVSYLESNSWTTYTAEDGLPEDNVSSLLVDQNGAVWFGTLGSGVACLVPSNS